MNETRDLGEPSFPELGRNSIFIEVMVIDLLIILKLYFDISSVLELETN